MCSCSTAVEEMVMEDNPISMLQPKLNTIWQAKFKQISTSFDVIGKMFQGVGGISPLLRSKIKKISNNIAP